MITKQNETSVTGTTRKLAHRAWWGYLLWVPAAAILGFAVPAMFAGLLHLLRNIYLAPYVVLIGALLYSYLRWSNISYRGKRLLPLNMGNYWSHIRWLLWQPNSSYSALITASTRLGAGI